MGLESNDDELIATIKGLTPTQLQALSSQYSMAYLQQFFDQIKQNIAIEATTRIKSKIALYFNGGYATGALFDSIYYVIENNKIIIKSSKSYMGILNAGFDSFDMKAKNLGKRMKMRLPGGQIIWRTIGEGVEQDAASHKNLIIGTRKNWIHPGYQGKHIFDIVETEMAPWMKHHIQEQIWMLLSTVHDIPFSRTQEGYTYYNRRDRKGRFSHQ